MNFTRRGFIFGLGVSVAIARVAPLMRLCVPQVLLPEPCHIILPPGQWAGFEVGDVITISSLGDDARIFYITGVDISQIHGLES